MKKLKLVAAIMIFCFMLPMVAVCGDRVQSSTVIDSNRNFIGLAPKALVTITADAAITDANGKYYFAIEPVVDATDCYFDGTPGTTATISAGTIKLVNPKLRLGANTLCWVY